MEPDLHTSLNCRLRRRQQQGESPQPQLRQGGREEGGRPTRAQV